MATIKYYKIEYGQYVESDIANGTIPGISWMDVNGNGYRAVISGILQASYEMQICEYQYKKFIQPVGTDVWLLLDTINVSINNSNYVNAATGELIVGEIPEGVTAIPQYIFFDAYAGKNVNSLPFPGIHTMQIGEVLRRENLTLDA